MNNRTYVKPSFGSFEEAFVWLEEQVDDPCVDNYRSAYMNDPFELELYHTAKDEGCCGSFDS